MKYDMLQALRTHLREKYVANTADKYYFAVVSLLDGLECPGPEQIPAEDVCRRMDRLKTRNDFSAAKRGLLELRTVFPDATLPDSAFLEGRAKSKRNYKKRGFEPLVLDTVRRKINALRDKKLKLAFRLMLASGARVAEVAELRPEDISITGDGIELRIEHGKGDKRRVVAGIRDDYLERELPALFAATAPGSMLFYADATLKKKAGELGIECHDLRRAFAKEYYAGQRQIAPDAETARSNLMAALGHESFRTTKRYLRRKIVK